MEVCGFLKVEKWTDFCFYLFNTHGLIYLESIIFLKEKYIIYIQYLAPTSFKNNFLSIRLK